MLYGFEGERARICIARLLVFSSLTAPVTQEQQETALFRGAAGSSDEQSRSSRTALIDGATVTLTAPPLPGVPQANGRTLSAEPSAGAAIHLFDVMLANGTITWDVAVIGGSAAEIPAVPAGFSDPLSGDAKVEVVGIHLQNLDIDNLAFTELGLTDGVGFVSRTGDVTF